MTLKVQLLFEVVLVLDNFSSFSAYQFTETRRVSD